MVTVLEHSTSFLRVFGEFDPINVGGRRASTPQRHMLA